MGRRVARAVVAGAAVAVWVLLALLFTASSTAPADVDRPPLPASTIRRLLTGATVRLAGFGCATSSDGTGVVLEDGRLVTNRHVVDGMRALAVVPDEGTVVGATARVSQALDLALVEPVSGHARRLGPGVVLADRDAPPGTAVTVAGYPADGDGRLRVVPTRIVDRVDGATVGQPRGTPVVRLRARLPHGMSGSPVVDERAAVVAVVFGVERSSGLTLALPARVVRDALAAAPFTPVRPC